MDDLSGRIVKGYELRELIGMGGFAAVYRAYQFAVEREVAIKIILPKYANAPDFIRRFQAEAQLIARLEHIHIVPLYDHWREPNNAYLVMRWLRGGSLHDHIQERGAWDLPSIARLLDQITSALAIAHRNEVIHQDLTPANILFDDEGNAYLTDFGIAKGLFTYERQSGKEPLFGSPAYMSPEQIMRQDITPETDIYSLGIVLYQLLTGSVPFNSPNITDVLSKQVNEPAPPLQLIRPELPYTLNVVISQATSKSPHDRYHDAPSLAAAFRMAIQDLHPTVRSGATSGVSGRAEASPYQTQPLDVPTDVYTTHEVDVSTRQFSEGMPSATQPLETLNFGMLIELQNPYKGLRPFEEADANTFFGRTEFIARLIERLNEPSPDGHFLAVIGPSGSGKSSVVRAGLIPALQQNHIPGASEWFTASMVPGAQPFAELQTALLSISTRELAENELLDLMQASEHGLSEAIHRVLPRGDEHLLLLIDQFEELFTQVENEAQQRLFLNNLRHAVNDPASQLRVITTLRADFYDRPLLFPEFGELVRARTEVVLPLSTNELHETIVGPAEKIGLALEPGLASAIVADVTQQPGALPLLQYALTELFERRQDRLLTLEAYQGSGGVRGALARRAEDLYEEMDAAHQAAVRQLFLRLVTIEEGSDNTRRRVRWAEIMAVPSGQESTQKKVMQTVLETYGKFRLLTFDHDLQTREPTIEVAHEALIREWQRLREWLETNRADLITQRRLAVATTEWINTGRDTSFLARGERLVRFKALLNNDQLALTEDESAYIQASISLDQRRQRIVRGAIASLIILTLLAVTAAIFAFDRQQRAQDAETVAKLNERKARSGELSALALKNSDQIDLALLLNLEAFNAADTLEARNSLLTLLQSNAQLDTLLHDHHSPVRSVAFNPDGSLLATGARDGQVILWDTATNRAIGQPLDAQKDRINALAFSPDGSLLAVGVNDGTIYLWQVANGELAIPPLEHHAGPVWGLALQPEGNLLAAGSEDGTISLWTIQQDNETQAVSADLLHLIEPEYMTEVFALAFSPDGQLLASGGGDNLVSMWDMAEPDDPALIVELESHTNWVFSIAFSSDGALLASGSADNTVQLWDVASLAPYGRPLSGHSGWVRSLAFSEDGQWLASGDTAGTALVWDTASGRSVLAAPITVQGEIWGVDFQPGTSRLATGASNNQVQLWNITSRYPMIRQMEGHFNEVLSVAVSPDGSLIASASGASDGTGDDLSVRLWNAKTGEQTAILEGHEAAVSSLAFSPDGRLLASGSIDRTIKLWDVATGAQAGELSGGHIRAILAIAFSPDGNTIVSGGDDSRVVFWDVPTQRMIGEPVIEHQEKVETVAISPDGKLLASGSLDNTIILWDIASRRPLGEPLTSHTNAVMGLAFSPDGTLLASGSRDNTIILWDVATREPSPPLEGHDNYVVSVAFNSDGTLLASSSWDTTVRLWDVATGQQLGLPLQGHQDRVSQIAFSPDDRWLVSGSWDRTVAMWNVDLPDWKQRACQIVNRNLSPTEWSQFFQGEPYAATCLADSLSQPSNN